jgi:hypothetical protein
VATRNFQKFQEACLVGVSGAGDVTEPVPRMELVVVSLLSSVRTEERRSGHQRKHGHGGTESDSALAGLTRPENDEVARQGRRRHGSEKTVCPAPPWRVGSGGVAIAAFVFTRHMPCIGVDASSRSRQRYQL